MPSPRAGLDHEMGAGGQRLRHGAAHLLLLGPVLAAWHLRGDLVEPGHSVVARLAGVRRASRRGKDVG